FDSLFFFSSRRRHTRFSRDWSSDVCSSDLTAFQTRSALRPSGPTFSLRGFGSRKTQRRSAKHSFICLVCIKPTSTGRKRSTIKWKVRIKSQLFRLKGCALGCFFFSLLRWCLPLSGTVNVRKSYV